MCSSVGWIHIVTYRLSIHLWMCLHVTCRYCAHYLFSVEQKNVTQGLRTVLSVEEGRYMASEKQVSNNLSSSVLKRISGKDQ